MPDSILPAVRVCTKCGSKGRNAQGKCVACKRASDAAYRAANPEKVKAATALCRAANPEKVSEKSRARYAANLGRERLRSANYHAANREKRAAYQAAHYAANREKILARKVAYYAVNPEPNRIHNQNRRARTRKNEGVLSKGLSAKLFNLQRGKCACCGLPLGNNYHLDHIMPIALGGLNIDSNMQLLRQRCNSQKHAKHPIDFMQSRGYLL